MTGRPDAADEFAKAPGCTVTLVAAVAANGVIGRDGGLPWHLPADLRHLKRLTRGHVVVMGRRTFDSIGKPLPERTTIVVTRQPDWRAEGVLIADGVPQALARAGELDDQVFVLGGEEIFRLALPASDAMVISEVDARPDGDTVFPPVDWAAWREVARERYDGFDVVTYIRRDPPPATPSAAGVSHAQSSPRVSDRLRTETDPPRGGFRTGHSVTPHAPRPISQVSPQC